MEIEQYLYDLTDSGDAIVAYSMVSKSGATVQLCNMGASVLSFTMPDGEGGVDDILSGCCTKGLIEERESFEERLWESRVEFNRVIMSLSYECEGVGISSEVVFDFDDEDSFEITYQAVLEAGDAPFDLTHRMHIDLGGKIKANIKSQPNPQPNPQPESQRDPEGPRETQKTIHPIEGAKRGILSEIATLEGEKYKLQILSSHPSLLFDGESTLSTQTTLLTLTSPVEVVEEGTRFVQKSLFRPTRV